MRWYHPSPRLRDLTVAVMRARRLPGLAVMTRPPPDSISKFFLERAYTDGGGTNVVNVILVDFRGFDTLGEITVLGVVALTVFALLRRFRPAADSVGVPEQQHPVNGQHGDHPSTAPMADLARSGRHHASCCFRSCGTMAVFLFLRGHDLPGGGFVAGITMAIALILQYMAGGTAWWRRGCASGPSAGSRRALDRGQRRRGAMAFLPSFPDVLRELSELPFIGAVPLPSAIIFDLGVFCSWSAPPR